MSNQIQKSNKSSKMVKYSMGDKMIEYNDVKDRIESLNYNLKEKDQEIIEFCINKVSEYIKNYCNVLEVPEGVKYAAIDMVCGEFLQFKYTLGELDISDIDLDVFPVKSVTEGDTSVSYAVNDNESESAKILSFINKIQQDGKNNLYRYRRFAW